MPTPKAKKTILFLIKLAISVGLLTYVVVKAQGDHSFDKFWNQPKDWTRLFAAFIGCLTAVVLSFLRWWLLVRALDLPFRIRDAMRLGSLGYLLNFFSLGSVGGDLFKAVFIAREQPQRRTEAVATVVVDRVVGLYALLLVASGAVLFSEMGSVASSREIEIVGNTTLMCAAVGAVMIMLLLVPGFTGGNVTRMVGRLPGLGPTMSRLIHAIRVYREKYRTVACAGLLSIGVHSLLVLSFYLISSGFPGIQPTLGHHFLIVPLSMVAAALPLPMAGLGAFEFALDQLYRAVARPLEVARGQGLLVALCYRLMTVLIAVMGTGYYLSSRREVAHVMKEAQDLEATG